MYPLYVLWLFIWRTKIFDVPPQENKQANERPKKWPKPHLLSDFFWAASWSFRLRPAQQTQRRLLDQLWALIACVSIPFFFPTLPPSETCFMDLLLSLWGFSSSFVLKRLTLPQWTGLVILRSWMQHYYRRTPTKSDPMAYRSCPQDATLHGGFIALPFAMFSPSTRISAGSCSHGFSMCEIRSQELADPPPRCVWLEPQRHSRDCTLKFLFKPLYLVGIKFCSS